MRGVFKPEPMHERGWKVVYDLLYTPRDSGEYFANLSLNNYGPDLNGSWVNMYHFFELLHQSLGIFASLLDLFNPFMSFVTVY